MASSTITVKSSRDPNYPRVDRAENFASSEPNTNENRYVARINLIPLADSIIFSQKQLRFAPAQEIRVGRLSASRNQKESKSDNGVFDCDVMSREHAILKEDGGKIMIKDLKSTHGTFINNTRLGDGLQVSEWKVLNHNDVITFGHNVRRNQNLYKHLSARVSYLEENINTNSIINNTPTLSDDIKGTEASSNEVKNLGGLLNQKDNVSKNQINTEPASVVKQSINVNQENGTHADNINDASPPPGIDDKVDVGSPEKPVTPAITPDHHPASPIAETSINKDEDEVDKNTPLPLDIKIQEDIPLQIVQVSNQIHISHKEVNSDINGEGPSILDQKLEETAVVKLTTSRKRKYEDMEDEKNETEGTELGCRLAEKEGSASKRIRLEVLLSAAVGFTIGATGVFLYYLSGTPSL